MGGDDSESDFDKQMQKQMEQNNAEIQQKRQQLFDTALGIQKSIGGQSWTGEPL